MIDPVRSQPSSPFDRTSPSRVRWGVVAILMAFSFMTQFNRVSMAVAGDRRIMGQYGLSPVQMGQVYSAFLLTYTLCMAPGGWVIDRIGTRAALAGMGFGSALFVALTGAIGMGIVAAGLTWYALIVTRGLMGVTSAPIYPACAEAARRWFPPGRRALPSGLITAAAPLGIAATYIVFGALIRWIDWPVAFLITGAATAALAGIWTWYATDRPDEHPWVNAAERALIHGGGPVDATVEAGGVPMGWSALLADRGLMLLTLSYAAVSYFQYLFVYWMNYYFMTVMGLGESASESYAALPQLAWGAGMPLGGWLSGRAERAFGPRARGWIAAGGMVAAAGLLGLGIMARGPDRIVAWFALAMGAIGVTESLFWVTAVERGGSRGGTAAAIMNTGGNAGGVIAPV
jgi:MFS family permease